MTALIHRILHAGTEHRSDPRAKRQTVVHNVLTLICFGVTFFYVGFFALVGAARSTPILLPTLLFHMLTIWLNYKGHLLAARRLLMVVANTSCFVYFNVLGLNREVSLFFATACLPLVVTELEDWPTILLGVSLSLGYAIAMTLGGVPMGAPLLTPSMAFAVHLSLVAVTIITLLVIVLSFVISNLRAEGSLQLAHKGLQCLLDSVDQGFATLDRGGLIQVERSATFDRWFGTPAPNRSFADCLEQLDAQTAEMFRMGWSQIEEAFLPLELLLAQLPSKLVAGGRHYELSYKPDLSESEELTSLLVVMSDVTAQVEREHVEESQRELLRLLGRFTHDRHGFREFLDEADQLVGTIATAQSEAKRALHTLKGNCALFGATEMASYCHELETRLMEVEDSLSDLDRSALMSRWSALRLQMRTFVGDSTGSGASVESHEVEVLRRRVGAGAPIGELLGILDSWEWEPTANRLGRVSEQIQGLARRLGKSDVAIESQDSGLRLEPKRWAAFWSSFAHVVRNTVDHGLETAEERRVLGKPSSARVVLRTRLEGERLVVEIGDDGRGIDWPKVALRATAQGLDASSRSALAQALFLDGFSTREEVTELSGRGVGLAAVRKCCEELGGQIAIESELGHGTLFRFTFPSPVGRSPAWRTVPC